MNGLTRSNLPLMMKIERIAQNADVEEILDMVETADYTTILRDFHYSVERVFGRLIDDYYGELSAEQLAIANVALRSQLVLMFADHVFSLLTRLGTSESSPAFQQLSNVLFSESEESPNA